MQERCVEHLRRWSVGALFMEAGTGKTLTAIRLIQSAQDVDLVLWIAPLRTLDNAMDEFVKWGAELPVKMVGVESIGCSDRIYADTMQMVECASNPFIVVDESLKIKNIEAKRTKRVLELGKKAKYKLILNGTPVSRNLLDVWAQMQFLSPKILNMSLSRFKNTFCEYKIVTKRHNGHIAGRKEYIVGYDNIDYLYSLISNYIFESELYMTITQQFKDVYYTVSKDSKERYDEIKRAFLSDDMLEYRNNNIFLAMTSKMQHSYCIDKNKLEALNGIMEKLDNSKTIIFCRFVNSQELLSVLYPQAKVLSYQSGAFGLNLQEYTNTVFFDKVWDYALRLQATRRTFRTGQTNNCQYYDLTGDVKLDGLFDKCISKKISMLDYFKSKSKEEINEEI